MKIEEWNVGWNRSKVKTGKDYCTQRALRVHSDVLFQSSSSGAHVPVEVTRWQKHKSFFFWSAPFAFRRVTTWGLLADQRGIEPPPAVCQRYKSATIPTEPRGHHKSATASCVCGMSHYIAGVQTHARLITTIGLLSTAHEIQAPCIGCHTLHCVDAAWYYTRPIYHAHAIVTGFAITLHLSLPLYLHGGKKNRTQRIILPSVCQLRSFYFTGTYWGGPCLRLWFFLFFRSKKQTLLCDR